MNATRCAKARLREKSIDLAGAKLAAMERTWSLRGNEGRLVVTVRPAMQRKAAMLKAMLNPNISATNPATSAPMMPAPDSKASWRPMFLPDCPSALRLMYDCAADQ